MQYTNVCGYKIFYQKYKVTSVKAGCAPPNCVSQLRSRGRQSNSIPDAMHWDGDHYDCVDIGRSENVYQYSTNSL